MLPKNQNITTLPFYAKLALSLVSILIIGILMIVGKTIIIPLFFSALIAMLLLPLTKWLERRRLPKSLAAFLALLVFLSFVAGIIYFLVLRIIDFSHHADDFQTNIMNMIGELQVWIKAKYHIGADQQIAYITKWASGAVSAIGTGAQVILLSLIEIIIWTIFVFIFTFFLLTHRGLIRRFITGIFDKSHHERLSAVITDTRTLANSYVLGLLMEMVIVAFLNCTVLALFGVKYALLLGMLGAILNIIPYLGIYSGAAIAALVTLANGSPQLAITVVIIFIAVHFVDANIILPRIVGGRVKMNPLITIVAVLLGNLVWGIPGMFLFIPLFAILKLIFERVNGLRPWAMLIGTDD